jgi:hypothetical protein
MTTAAAAPRSRVLACVLTLAATLVIPQMARAQGDDAAAVEKVTKLNKKAVEEYENLNFEEARKILKDALDICTQAGLDNHPIKARTHVHLGVVILAGFHQRDLAVKQFKKALEIQPDIKLTKSLANPEIQEAFDEAASQAGKPDIVEKQAGEPLVHEPVTQGTQGRPVSVRATVDQALGAKRVVLNFKPDGAAEFVERDMTEVTPGNWATEIPASVTGGNRVAYYIEVEGDKEQTLASKGTEDAPLMVTLKGAGAPAVTSRKAPPRRRDDTPKDEGGPRWYIGLGFGSGSGWTTGKGEVNADHMINPAGFAPSSLGQVEPEVGYFVKPNLMLSLQLRFQYITGPTSEPDTFDLQCGSDHLCSPSKYALSGFAKATYFFGDGNLHPFVSGSLGGGYIRHVAAFPSVGNVCGPTPASHQQCVDTVAGGPILLGPGAGLLYNVTDMFALTLNVSTYVGLPSNFTFHVDGNVGVALEF